MGIALKSSIALVLLVTLSTALVGLLVGGILFPPSN